MRSALILLSFAALATPAFGAGFELPPRKAGQWEMSIQASNAAMAPQIIKMCLDAETDKLMNERFGGVASRMCSKQEQKKEGDSIILDSECKIGEMKSQSHTVVTGDFDTAYTMKSEVKMSGSNAPTGIKKLAPDEVSTQVTTIEAKRTGECAAGVKPGDIDLGGGRVMNVRDMPAPNLQ